MGAPDPEAMQRVAAECVTLVTAQIAHVSAASVHVQHPGVVTTRLRVPRRSAHHLGPVGRQPSSLVGSLHRVGAASLAQ
jgi:hypothetical protein